MRGLLDSIYRQFPIGSLLVWETDTAITSLEWIGPVQIPQSKGTAGYVLDGHQRLSTLAGVLMPPQEDGEWRKNAEDPDRWFIWFNAKDGFFEHPKGWNDRPEAWHFPMNKLLNTVEFLQECRRMIKQGGADGNNYVMRVEELMRGFQGYQFPLTRIKNTDLNQAVEIFARLNSTGRRMSADQMVSALMYKENVRSLAEYIDIILKALVEKDFVNSNDCDNDRVIVLRALLAVLGEDIYRTNWTQLTSSKRAELEKTLPDNMDKTKEALLRATDFLRELEVHNRRLLPYAMQLVVLSAFFSACPNPTTDQKKFLERWFWVSSFTGWFASGNPSRVGGLVKEFKDKIAHDPAPQLLDNMRLDEPAQAFPDSFDMRSARTRTLLLVLLSLRPRGTDGEELDEPWRRVSERGPDTVGRIAATVKDKRLFSSPVNRILKPDMEDASQAKNWLARLGNLSAERRSKVLQSHAITEAGYSLLTLQNNADEFLREREKTLIDLDREFMSQRGVRLPLEKEARPPPVDTD